MTPSTLIETWEWAVMHGVAGVLTVLVIVQTLVIRTLYARMEKNEEARIDDMRAFNAASAGLHDKVHRTVSDINRVIDFMERRKDMHS